MDVHAKFAERLDNSEGTRESIFVIRTRSFEPAAATKMVSLPPLSLFFLVLAHLLREVAFVAEFLDLVHLGFEEVDVLFFVLEQCHK